MGNLLVMASNLLLTASNLLVMASNLLAMASNLYRWPPTWLIMPVVTHSSQRLSHACLSIAVVVFVFRKSSSLQNDFDKAEIAKPNTDES